MLLSLFVFSLANTLSAFEISELSKKIAILKNNEVWILDQGGREAKQITKTDGKVEEFHFSPDLSYLAYTKVINYVEEPGVLSNGEDIPKIPVFSIVVMDVKTRKIVRELMPPESEWIHPIKWLPKEKLLFYSSDGVGVHGYFEFDVSRNVEVFRDPGEYHLVEADYTRDGTLMVYVQNSALHVVDMSSGVGKTVSLSRKDKLLTRISHDKRKIAWIEVKMNYDMPSINSLISYDLKTGRAQVLYEGPSPGLIGAELSWSHDDRAIGIFYRGKAVVTELREPNKIHEINGTDFTWLPNRRILYSKGSDIFKYSLDTGRSDLFIKNSSHAAYLWK